MSDFETSCGYAAIIGLPNAGKSTLINALVGQKISIVSRKVQTTRFRVVGIVNNDQTQVVFVDTPGVFLPKKTLERAMVANALESMNDADVVLHLVDTVKKDTLEANRGIIAQLPTNKPCWLVLNKVDVARRIDLMPLAASFNEAFSYEKTFMVSAATSSGLNDLMGDITQVMPQGPWLFAEDQVTDMPMRMLAAELTREKIFDRLHEELPYEIFVETIHWENFDNGDIKVSQTVYVQRDSQKGIVLGKGGRQIKEIGTAVREELSDMLERRVHLSIMVKVQENWSERAENYRLMGLEIKS
ncbi:MAG: GTPase Era [Alphaproteobacteria bacterium]|nr:GTPase Era [Alphaproteobacteria bacterium]MCD8526199.1 GTPase Era [Alphaproteobacteria bacterium]MCD8570153.1 GTPase Era [Alphaproteobacteria bacterium]